MNVYEKLNQARIDFQSANFKKSGVNSYAGYTYYELADILPAINVICSKLKATVTVSFDNDLARLDFIDCEKPEDKITFTSPMSEANQKGCQPVQNLGSVQTYIKRYLYMNCFSIIESDGLEMMMNPKEVQKVEKQKVADTKATFEIQGLINQVKQILSSANNFNEKQIKYAQWCIDNGDKKGLELVIQSVVDAEGK